MKNNFTERLKKVNHFYGTRRYYTFICHFNDDGNLRFTIYPTDILEGSKWTNLTV